MPRFNLLIFTSIEEMEWNAFSNSTIVCCNVSFSSSPNLKFIFSLMYDNYLCSWQTWLQTILGNGKFLLRRTLFSFLILSLSRQCYEKYTKEERASRGSGNGSRNFKTLLPKCTVNIRPVYNVATTSTNRWCFILSIPALCRWGWICFFISWGIMGFCFASEFNRP